jgi:predicted PurR-regulated permease PerM
VLLVKERLNNRYVKFGLTIFWAGVALIVVFLLLTHLGNVGESLSNIKGILSPFIFGFVMAYLLCPVYNAVVRRMYRLTWRGMSSKKKALRWARVMGTLISLLVLFGVVGGLFALVLPETIRSIVGLISVLPQRINDLMDWGSATFTAEKYPQMAESMELILEKIRDAFTDWAQNTFLPSIGDYMTQISMGVIVTVRTVVNMFIGVIVCVYLLNGKERFKAQAKKIIVATASRDQAQEIFEFGHFTNRTFGGFINGKLIDSLIIGILCFILMSIFKLPYTVLVSTIIGVTNFIPFFGPFIGAIPSTIIICVVSPLKALYFIILVLALQIFDGNILGPKILGDTTGLTSFWVMFAIIVSGGLFGFTGMVLGVPVFAVIYYYIGRYIKKRLARRNLPTETWEYQDFNQYDIDRKDVL